MTTTITPAGNSDVVPATVSSTRVFGAGNSNLVGRDIRRLLHVSGSRGLVHDAAGGALTNTRAASTVVDYEGVSRNTKANEVRRRGARRIQNIIVAPEDFTDAAWTKNSISAELSGTKTFVDVDGETKTVQLTRLTLTGGNVNHYVQRAIVFTNQWVAMYVDATGILSKRIDIVSNGGTTGKITAIWNSPQRVTITASSGWEYSYMVIGDYQAIFYCRAVTTDEKTNINLYLGVWGAYDGDGEYADASAVMLSETAGTSNNPIFEYINPTAEYNSGVTGVKYSERYDSFTAVHCWGDSFVQGSALAFYIQMRKSRYATVNGGVAGENTTQIKARFLPDANKANRIQILWDGRNTIAKETAKADIIEMIDAMPHAKWVVCSWFNSADEPAGSSTYNDIMWLNNEIATLYPGHFIDVRQHILDSYDPNNEQDVIDVSNDIPPSSLRGDVQHLNEQGNALASQFVVQFMIDNGILDWDDQISDIAILHDGDAIKLPVSVGTNFKHDKGIVIVKLRMKAANSAGNKALFAFNTGATDFLYDNGSGGIALSDGTNTATAAVGGWIIDDELLIGVCYDSGTSLMSVHVSKNGGAWTDSSDVTYDGAFPIGSNIVWASGNTDSMEIMSTIFEYPEFSHSDQIVWLKANANNQAV